MSFGQRLHDLRVEHKLSLQKVADQVGLSKAHIWNLEKEISENPSIEVATKLADLFKVRIADLVGENPNAKSEDPQMVAMFRDLKRLDETDRKTIQVLMEQLKKAKVARG